MKRIDAVEMVRRIRDKQNKDTSGESPQEIVDYFRKKAGELAKKTQTPELSER